jgi:hypothetical protein
MKSMETLSHGSLKIGKSLYSSYFFYYKWTLCYGILHKCAQNDPHPLSFQTSRTFFLWPPLWFVPHNAMPWAHHALLA